MRELFDTIRRVARYDVNVCIEGETGSGKELVAAEVHRLSPRGHEPFVTLNCGAIPDPLLESELFGHEKGAFTGADRRRTREVRAGRPRHAVPRRGGRPEPAAQVALLRAIQQGEVVRVGGEKPVHVDVRIVTATHQDLARCVAEGRFRSDLYFRLNQVVAAGAAAGRAAGRHPAAGRGDILARLRVRLGRELSGVTREFEDRLRVHAWPGNVRELEHVICRAAILEDGGGTRGAAFRPGVLAAVGSASLSRGEGESSAFAAGAGGGGVATSGREQEPGGGIAERVAEDAVLLAAGAVRVVASVGTQAAAPAVPLPPLQGGHCGNGSSSLTGLTGVCLLECRSA